MWKKFADEKPDNFRSCIGKYQVGNHLDCYALFVKMYDCYRTITSLEEQCDINPPVKWMYIPLDENETDDDFLHLNIKEIEDDN